jgi:hypothetical protein
VDRLGIKLWVPVVEIGTGALRITAADDEILHDIWNKENKNIFKLIL